jgi:phytoene desaturase
MKKKFTASAVMVYLGCDRRYDHLPHHNAVFGEGYRETFTTIFDKLAIPDDPSFYVCRPTATDPSLAPPGKDIIYLLIPVPYEAPGQDWEAGLQPLLDSVYDRCARQLGMADLKRQTVVSRRWMPSDWREQFNLAKGSAFGLSHDFRQVGYFRPSNRHAKVPNLYFVGASTQPGTGVPMVFLSSRLVAERIIQEQPQDSAPGVLRTSLEPMEV